MKEDVAIKYAEQCGQLGATMGFLAMMLDTDHLLTKREIEMLREKALNSYNQYKEAFDEK